MKQILRRLCGGALCLMMIFGLSARGVAASDVYTPKNQIGKHFEADDITGEASDTPELYGDTSKSYADDWLRTNKTITPGEGENEFLITLDVRTKAEIQNIELSPDAAVVLVIDLSGSMKEDKRLEKAKQAAKSFIDKFAETGDEKAIRKIAVVGFSGQQEISGGFGAPRQKGITAATAYQPWTDADDLSVFSAIDSMNAEGGTCLQAGLILASNLLGSKEAANIASKNIVVLTDGRPTYYLSEEAAKDTSDQSIGAPQTIRGTGSSTDHSTHTKTENTAKAVLATGINVYGIFLGNDGITCSERSCGLRKTGADWLRENCGFITYAVENAGDLSNIFENISELIRLQAKAWIAEDPLGEMFDFNGFVTESQNENEYFYNSADKKIAWNLRLSTPAEITEDGFNVYRLTYKVKLNTLAPDYTANRYYPTNGITSVTWFIEKTTDSGVSEIENGTAYFNLPSAKGYAADISFRKTDENGLPLAGAKFGLYYEEAPIAVAMSDSDGRVLFENVPSGHSYTIFEESAPEGFSASAEKYDIAVAYGSVVGTVGVDNTVINYKNQPVIGTNGGDLIISKTVARGDRTKAFTFTVTLDNPEVNGKYGDLIFINGVSVFRLKDGQNAVAEELPAGVGYTVGESDNDGYTVTVNGTGDSVAEGKILENETAAAAFLNDKIPDFGGEKTANRIIKEAEPVDGCGDETIPPDSPENPPAPQTGDRSNLRLWIILLCLSLLHTAILMMFRQGRYDVTPEGAMM